jgi:phage protein D
MTFATPVELSARPTYRGFYVPHFEVRVDGVSLPQNVVQDVLQLTYKDNVKEIDSVDLTVNNWDSTARRSPYIGSESAADLPRAPGAPSGGRGAPDPLATLFEPGIQKVEIWLGYLGELRRVTTVSFTSLEPSFPSGGPPVLQVRGLNVLHSLRRKQHTYAWVKEKPSTIAFELGRLTDGNEKRLELPVVIDEHAREDEPLIDYIAQDNQYDIDFLLNLARRQGYDLTVDERAKPRHLLFAPSKTALEPVAYRLTWGETLVDFKPRLSTARQFNRVTVKGWDRRRKRPIKVTVDLQDRVVKRINPDLHRLIEGAGGREELVVDEPVFTDADARERGRAILLDQLKQMVTAEGTTVGLPDLRAGSTLAIEGFGARLSGEYFVTETTHAFSDAGYTTRFKARRETKGAV